MLVETMNGGMGIQVDDLDDDFLLSLVSDAEVQDRQAQRRKLRYAVQWAHRHPATGESDAATWAEVGRGGGGLDCDEAIAGDGAPLVAAFAAEPFAAAMGISTAAGIALIADGLNLHHRHPRIWAKVEALEVPAWRARRVAQMCASQSAAVAAHVDAALADRMGAWGVTTIENAIAAALADLDPENVSDAEDEAKAAWGVHLTHRSPHALGVWAGTSTLEITGDTAEVTALHDLICATAHQLLTDDSPFNQESLEVRKARAVGVIATQSGGHGVKPVTRMYVHIDVDDLADPTATGWAERLGPATLSKIRDWLAGTRATILPVLDMRRTDAVDRHDPPAWMAEQVRLRDAHCVFPWCQKDSRGCDLDHIEPYIPLDEGGPPGQTNPRNLGPLCRRHHRCKTSRRWHYRRNTDGTYTWTGPHGRTYTVTSRGTFSEN
ncbi:hypothetical protein FB382_002050 [Nocardioides ginsengisegetis]|uniref:HNH nuclease domain-containing protein n=1 Tax=Nocardioides ginsengisegetis TaxID=661491 RepID=A0A7W3P9T6_9ACTN|nr:HNH endonuclease signature motif containing protein [Nocardioides ginsengisegetis]MBA8803759.1 hypothetical protein [Nocardioides ginsengisegetis]